MFFLTFIAGLVLLIAGQGWFEAAETVGWILLAVTVGLFLLQVFVFGLFTRKVNNTQKSFFNDFR